MTPATLADMLDINRRTTERWEAGSTPIPAWLPDKLAELWRSALTRDPGALLTLDDLQGAAQ